MAVYHFTIHAYRSWSPNHRRGYTRWKKGYEKPDPERAKEYDRNAKHPRVNFDRAIQEILILGTIDVCKRRGWRLHGAATDPTHLHVAVSWHGFLPWNEALRQIKNVLSYLLGRCTDQRGRRWFVQHGSRRRITDHEHLTYLLKTYFLTTAAQSGSKDNRSRKTGMASSGSRRLLPDRTELPLLVREPRAFVVRYRVPLLVLLVGAVLDAVTTYRNLVTFGAGIEVHPAHRLVFEWFGTTWGVPVGKLAQLGFVVFVAAWWRPWCAWLLGGCGVLYTLAAISNHFLLL